MAGTSSSSGFAVTVVQSTAASSASSQPQPNQTSHDNLGAYPSGLTSSSASASSTPDSINSDGLVHYYFVFIALILVVVGIAIFLFFRKKRMARAGIGRIPPGGRARTGVSENARHQAWLGRRRSAEVSREEGLNEQGEAPPPYVPKSVEESNRTSQGSRQQHGAVDDVQEPGIPLQDMSRDTGSKLPGYEEHVREVGEDDNAPSSSAQASSRHPT